MPLFSTIGSVSIRGFRPSGKRPFTPADLSGNKAWYKLTGDPSPSTYIMSGNNVALVADRSGNSNSLGVLLPAITGNYIKTPQAESNVITGDIGARIVYTVRGPIITSSDTLFSNSSFAILRQYSGATGTTQIRLSITIDGGTSYTIDSDNDAFNTVGNGRTVGVGFTRRKSDGLVTFYTSTDGSTWNVAGATKTLRPGDALSSTPGDLRVGSGANSASFPIFVKRFELFNDATFTNRVQVMDPQAEGVAKMSTSFTASTGETWTLATSGVIKAAICGLYDSVQPTASKQPFLRTEVDGSKSLSYDGTDDAMYSGLNIQANSLAAYAVFTGLDHGAATGGRVITIFSKNELRDWATNQNCLVIIHDTNVGSYRSPSTLCSTPAPTYGTRNAWVSAINGTACRLRKNIDTAITGTGPANSLSTDILVMGQNNGDSAASFLGYISEVLIRPADNTTDEEQILTYLKTTYNII